MKLVLSALLILILVPLAGSAAQERRPEADQTIVVYNTRDASSVELAKYYASRRQIAADHVIGLDCTTEEEIPRAEYDSQIVEPLRKIFTDRGWWKLREDDDHKTQVEENSIRFVALIRGIPLKIPQVDSYEGDVKIGPPQVSSRNDASVDSELACMGFFTRTISGALANPYYRNFTTIGEARIPSLMLVCRLDGPSPETVKRMIDDAIDTERDGLWGFAYIDSRNIKSGGLAEGDKWLLTIVNDALNHGIPVIHDNGPGLFPDDYPMRYAAFYYGWLSDNVCGPFARPSFRFVKGAIACHIHSFSAATLRDPTKNWAAPLLARGAACVLGNVYEPFLALTPNLDVFHERMEDGFTFAESAYMSVKVVSWMDTYIGDPLYKPFRVIDDHYDISAKPASEFAAYRTGADAWFKHDPGLGQRMLVKSGRTLHSGIVFEGLGLLQAGQNDFTPALISFRQARQFYLDSQDIIRVAIHEVSILKALHRNDEAHKLAQQVLEQYPNSVGLKVLQKLDSEVPEPSPSAPGPAAQ